MSERLRNADRRFSGNSILVSRSVEMETGRGFLSHRITPACRMGGETASNVITMARFMRQNLPNGQGRGTDEIGTIALIYCVHSPFGNRARRRTEIDLTCKQLKLLAYYEYGLSFVWTSNKFFSPPA
jgi:hypothetical protein